MLIVQPKLLHILRERIERIFLKNCIRKKKRYCLCEREREKENSIMDDVKFDVWALSHGNNVGFFFQTYYATH